MIRERLLDLYTSMGSVSSEEAKKRAERVEQSIRDYFAGCSPDVAEAEIRNQGFKMVLTGSRWHLCVGFGFDAGEYIFINRGDVR